jgi:hypothetical protein
MKNDCWLTLYISENDKGPSRDVLCHDRNKLLFSNTQLHHFFWMIRMLLIGHIALNNLTTNNETGAILLGLLYDNSEL